MKRNQLAVMTVLPVALGATWLAGCGQQPAQNTGAANTTENAAATGMETMPATKVQFERGVGFVSGGGEDTGWTLKVVNAKTGQPVKEFDTVHEQLMHLIVVSKDLSLFNHLHPQYKGNGTFAVTTKLPMPGKSGYKFYADYTPKGGTNEVQQHDVSGTDSTASLTADKLSNGWVVKNVVAGTETQLIVTPHKQLKADAGPLAMNNGPRYQVALMPMPAKLVAGKEMMLHFQVRDAAGKPLKDLQSYLGGMGHCVVISSDTNSYLHTHPMEESGESSGPDAMFHVTFPSPGLYKVWGEFKHRDKIVTAPFVVEVGAGESSDAQTDNSSDHSSHDQ